MSYLVFDIETVTDLSVWTPPPVELPPADPAIAPLPGQLALVGAPTALPTDSGIVIPPVGTPAKKSRSRKKPVNPADPPKEPFAPLYAHRVIAIGWSWLDLDGGKVEIKGVGCIGTSTFKDNEAGLLVAWDEFMRREAPTIVTYAGRGFDVPVLALRAFHHGVSQAWADKDYRYRYGDRHIDLFEHLTDYGLVPRTGFSLGTMSQLMGLPNKTLDGSGVAALWRNNEIAKIEAYCACDAVRTALVMLRYFLMRGRIGKEQYVRACQGLLITSTNMGLGEITFGIDAKRLLLEG
jgi:predicted PolB exonuclease-like 3'-5' exonuclease